MAFFNQPVSGECCPDPCTRSGPCDPCTTTTTTTTTLLPTTTTTLAPTTTTTTSTSSSTTTAGPCGAGSFVISGASSAYNGTYSSAGTYGPNDVYTNANDKHLFMDNTTIANSTWVISDDPVGSSAVYSADTRGGSCPDLVAWTAAGITIS